MQITKKKGHVTVKSLSIKLALKNEEIVPLSPLALKDAGIRNCE